MRVPFGEGLAAHAVLESCATRREGRREMLTQVRVGQPFSRGMLSVQDVDASLWIAIPQWVSVPTQPAGPTKARLIQLLQGSEQIEERTAPPIQAPDDDGIEVTSPSRFQYLFALWTCCGLRANFLRAGTAGSCCELCSATDLGHSDRRGYRCMSG